MAEGYRLNHSPSPSTRAIFNMAWPLTFKAVMLHGIMVIDTYLVSPLGEASVAALGLATALGGFLLGMLFAFSSATQIWIAQAYGSNDRIALKTGFYTGLAANLAVAVMGLVVVFTAGSVLVSSFAQSEWIADQASRYLSVLLVVVLIEAVGQCVDSHFNGCGKTNVPFYSYLLAVPVNIMVSYLLIHGLYGFPELGVMGAAVGSAVGASVRTVFLSIGLYKENQGHIGFGGWVGGTFRVALKRYVKFALPVAGIFVSAALAKSVTMLIYAKMSIHQFSAMTLILPWVYAAGTFGMSWAQATGIIVAQLLGRKSQAATLDAFLRRAWAGALFAATLVSGTYLLVCLSAHRIYADLQQETINVLLSFLPALLVLPFVKGSNAICGQTLRAGGDTLYALKIFIIGQWVFTVPLSALLVLYFGTSAAWVFALLLLEEIVKFPIFHHRFLSGVWRRGSAINVSS